MGRSKNRYSPGRGDQTRGRSSGPGRRFSGVVNAGACAHFASHRQVIRPRWGASSALRELDGHVAPRLSLVRIYGFVPDRAKADDAWPHRGSPAWPLEGRRGTLRAPKEEPARRGSAIGRPAPPGPSAPAPTA